MCNAWNHSVDCACGWGGEGHLGRRSFGNQPLLIAAPKFKTYGEYLVSCTIPNAKCPVCGSPVFFYRSPNNGRVFFDDLGPPWPKHPCTSGKYERATLSIHVTDDKENMAAKYFESREWKPFLLEGLFEVDKKNGITEIIGRIFDQRRKFYTRITGLTDDFPFFINESKPDIRLLTFKDDSDGHVFEFIVKTFMSDLTKGILVSSKAKNFDTSNISKGISKSKKKKLHSSARKSSSSPKKEFQFSLNQSKIIKNVFKGKLQEELEKIKLTIKNSE